MGQTARAIEYSEQALAIAREIGDRYGEGMDLITLAQVFVDKGRPIEAIQRALESVKIGGETGNAQINSEGNTTLTLAYLCTRDLPAARAAVEAARRYDVPQNNHYVLALLGVTAMRQGERDAAREAFASTVAQADELLAHTPQYYGALDSKGLALAGMALCCGEGEVTSPLQDAIVAYRAARAIDRDAGVVRRVLLSFQ